MATRAGSFAEQEALKLAFSYLANSIDAAALLPAAMSRQLITERQISECASELDPYKKAEVFLGHLQRAVNGDYIKFHAFVQALYDSGQASIARRLHDELTHTTRSMQSTVAVDSTEFEGAHVVVPDGLVEELADLRVAFAKLLRNYEKELLNSSEAQTELVTLLPRLFRKEGSSLDPDFKSNFNKLVEEKVSLFNIHYLKSIRSTFPEDVRAATRKLVDQYEQQRQHFMTGTTVSQFKKLFPASATPYRLSAEKVPVTLKLQSKWDSDTLDDLTELVNLFGVAGNNLHLSKVQEGCIAVTWLCSTADVKDLKMVVFKAADSLQTRGVLQVFVGEELMQELHSQPKQVTESHAHKPVTLHLVNETDIDYLCPICTEPLTEPFHTDCGHFLCHKCCDQLLSMKKTKCPTCRERDALSNARLVKYHQRMVNSLIVYCPDYKEGCEWMGELRHLSDHLDPNKGRCGIACIFGCGTYDRRPEMKEHKKHHCLKRPTTCEYCGYHNTRDIVTEKHYPVCLWYPKKQIINQAVAITPPPATVSPQYLYNLPPVVFTITDYQEMKQANEVWTSPPYYTHTRGYKFCLKVCPNGNGTGEGTHISVYACLMRGEYDDELEWPFKGDFNIEVCNWRKDMNNILETIHLNRYTDEDGTITSRVMDKETGSAYGYPKVISHTDLAYNSTTNTEYLHDDCLQVRVCDVAVYSTTALLHKTPSWQGPLTTTQSVCEFTFTEFSKRKQLNNQYFSPPFYTHPQGYKLYLIVDANGQSSGEGTHVSIYAYLMRGEHDQHLQWPFTGDIIIELLNWREDKEHYKETVTIVESHGFVQVTEGTYGNTTGYPQFISHSSLTYNSTTNTEYLQEDCLRLRVSVNISYSTALLHKTPSWQGPLTTTQSVGEFTLTEFSKRKQFSNQYYSPPFYTHPQGYKLCIRVYANGYGSGEGTHVSIFAKPMRGEYDQHLQWPITGDIIIELLNWRDNKEHYKMTMKIFESHGFVQVIEGTYGNSIGYDQFISHSSLPYNSTTNTEYLQEDCLRLRVNVANVK